MANGRRIVRKLRRAYNRGQDVGRRKHRRAVQRAGRRRRVGRRGCLMLPIFWR